MLESRGGPRLIGITVRFSNRFMDLQFRGIITVTFLTGCAVAVLLKLEKTRAYISSSYPTRPHMGVPKTAWLLWPGLSRTSGSGTEIR